MAGVIARRLGYEVKEYPADWRGKGKRAGIIRNLEMLDTKPDKVIAFWDGRSTGTGHTISEAKKRRSSTPAAAVGMWWWDKAHPLAVYMDVREAPRGSVGELTGHPEWNPNWSCEPTCSATSATMPFEDESFQLVVFDPPHVTREKQPPEGINGLKYGALHPETEQEDLRRGFAECWRVLRSERDADVQVGRWLDQASRAALPCHADRRDALARVAVRRAGSSSTSRSSRRKAVGGCRGR
jgi:hypothetical protein